MAEIGSDLKVKTIKVNIALRLFRARDYLRTLQDCNGQSDCDTCELAVICRCIIDIKDELHRIGAV